MLRLVMYARVVYSVGQTAAQQWILISRFYSEKRLIKCISWSLLTPSGGRAGISIQWPPRLRPSADDEMKEECR